MVCVYCCSPTSVTNSRQQRRTNDIWRRRRCTVCLTVFTAIERVDLGSALRVEHSPDRLEPFNRDRLFISLYESCKHRATAINDAAGLTQHIIARLLKQPEQLGVVTRQQIITVSQQVLRAFDRAAASYYAAYHPVD